MDGFKLLLAAVGFAMFFEGLPYFISPSAVRRYLALLLQLSDTTLRALGLTLMAGGLLVAWASLNALEG